jgi:hypothetical protein
MKLKSAYFLAHSEQPAAAEVFSGGIRTTAAENLVKAIS